MVHGMAHEQDLQILHPFFRLELKWEKMMLTTFFCFIITLFRIIAVQS